MLAGEPEHVGVEEKEEDEADGEQVHIKAEQDARLKEVPSLAAHAAEGVGAADHCYKGGNGEQRIGTVGGEAGEEVGRGETCEYKRVSSKERTFVRIEDLGYHAVLENLYSQG